MQNHEDDNANQLRIRRNKVRSGAVMTIGNIKTELITLLPRLQRYAGNLCRSKSDADDLVQMTCVRVLEKHEQFLPGTNFDRWAFTIMSSVQNNHLRAQKKHQHDDIAATNLCVKDDNETKAQHAQIIEMVQNLTITQKQAISLVYVEGFSYQETADILGVPIGTIMSRIARGRTNLSQQLLSNDSSAIQSGRQQ